MCLAVVVGGIASIVLSKNPLIRRAAQLTSTPQRTISTTPVVIVPDSAITQTLKIAIGAFYAICFQRALETTIAQLYAETPRLTPGSLSWEAISDRSLVTVVQLTAYVIWLSLYYIGNVRLYFQVPPSSPVQQILVHSTLTLSLSAFYLFAATIGRPSYNQLYLILLILMLDAVFPMTLYEVLRARERAQWVVRGIVQSSAIFLIILYVPESEYTDPVWSISMLTLMFLQLFVGVPYEYYLNKRRK